jgi:hypothetical protein
VRESGGHGIVQVGDPWCTDVISSDELEFAQARKAGQELHEKAMTAQHHIAELYDDCQSPFLQVV